MCTIDSDYIDAIGRIHDYEYDAEDEVLALYANKNKKNISKNNDDYEYPKPVLKDFHKQQLIVEAHWLTDLVVRWTYLVMFLFARIREFLQDYGIKKRMGPTELDKHKDFVSIIGGNESLFIRNIYRMASDVVNHVISSVPATKVYVKERVTHDFGWTYQFTGKDLLSTNMGSYNYLGFAENSGPITEFAASFVDKYGLYTSTSLSSITHGIVRQLEQKIAKFIGTEDAIIFPMGFGTNAMNIPVLIGKGGLILSDELNHSSIVLGCRLSGAKIVVFKHNDAEDLENKIVQSLYEAKKSKIFINKILIIVEGIYSMEGTICNLPEFIKIKKKYKAYLYVDEAHSIGALGSSCKGVTNYFDVNPKEIDILMGTLTKSFSGAGGYIAGNKNLIKYIRIKSHNTYYGCSTSGPIIGQVIGCLNTLEIIDENTGDTGAQTRAKTLMRNTRYLRSLLQKYGFVIYGHEDSPVVPCLIFHYIKGVYFLRQCLKRGIALVGVCFPAIPMTKCRVRFCLSTAHTKEDIDEAVHVCNDVAEQVKCKYAMDTAHDFPVYY